MRPRYITLLFGLGILALSCRKTANSTQYVNLSECISQGSNLDQAMLCFDTVVSDSRCNPNADCFQRGTVVARFTLSAKGQEAVFELGDNNLIPGIGTDTLLLGYHVGLVTVLPQPAIHVGTGNTIRAQVVFEHQ